jgi:hypothetical protein
MGITSAGGAATKKPPVGAAFGKAMGCGEKGEPREDLAAFAGL